MNTNQALGEHIEKLVSDLVQAHLKETQATVMAAVMRGFGAPNSQIKLTPSRQMKARSFRGRRSTADVSMLAERLYELICERPGELMVSFSAELGKTARELYGPMTALKNSGRIRTAGERNRTRYFPSIDGGANSTLRA
ncbi:MAG: winged helix-turn-helix domain-containing protein [Deltaproteobacteria bacterium]|nr:winged helix-turn-helix domain-containing protein [Deltaproteobacteria bacterium]MBK8010740.1 winged helix-turn-helix domain-containing protein [Deltaproteobacteria bacterium]MBK8011369.1 winged helix-turn-helix domain-containing protein [Deltaproteobacteria bacterium]MBK8013089.1 winged helix-turn-helix domain-containing protein [Deltaproteobacteria bacterium]